MKLGVFIAEATTVFRGTGRGGVSIPKSAGFTGAR
jgi:hypothetical protein